MLIAPASSPARPARRTTEPAPPEPAKPRMSEMFDTSPSLTPKTDARAVPPATERCSWWSRGGAGRDIACERRAGRRLNLNAAYHQFRLRVFPSTVPGAGKEDEAWVAV